MKKNIAIKNMLKPLTTNFNITLIEVFLAIADSIINFRENLVIYNYSNTFLELRIINNFITHKSTIFYSPFFILNKQFGILLTWIIKICGIEKTFNTLFFQHLITTPLELRELNFERYTPAEKTTVELGV
jgi:hypothetical protein